MFLMYLLLAASWYWGPLLFAFIDFKKAFDWLPWVNLWCMLAEELEVLEDIRTDIEALYY